MKTVAIWV